MGCAVGVAVAVGWADGWAAGLIVPLTLGAGEGEAPITATNTDASATSAKAAATEETKRPPLMREGYAIGRPLAWFTPAESRPSGRSVDALTTELSARENAADRVVCNSVDLIYARGITSSKHYNFVDTVAVDVGCVKEI